VARVAPREGLTLHPSDNREELDRARAALALARPPAPPAERCALARAALPLAPPREAADLARRIALDCEGEPR